MASPRFLSSTRCNWSQTRIASSEREVYPSAFQISLFFFFSFFLGAVHLPWSSSLNLSQACFLL